MKPTKAQAKAVRDAAEALTTHRGDAEVAVTAYNDAVGAAFAELGSAAERFNAARHDAWEKYIAALVTIDAELREAFETAAQEAGSELRDQHGERSEKWQESDAGTEADERIGELENASVEEWAPEEPDELELEAPEDLEPPDEYELDAEALGVEE